MVQVSAGQPRRNASLGGPCNKCEQCVSITKGSNIDIIELDAASHRGIDDVRALKDAVKLSAARARKKVYIIDEAHMLTLEASNALLKTLEEPPDHVIFILATTNPEKLIETIRSRCLNIVFKKATPDEITRSLDRAVKGEKIKIKEDNIKSEMWGSGKNYEEFTADFAAIEPIMLETELLTGLENKIIKLRREISDIGSIDEETRRAYEETDKRHKFLTTEFADLNGAVDSLKNLIGDLTKKIDADFKDGLIRINEEFNHYFRLMFGGGSAKLCMKHLMMEPAGSQSARMCLKNGLRI